MSPRVPEPPGPPVLTAAPQAPPALRRRWRPTRRRLLAGALAVLAAAGLAWWGFAGRSPVGHFTSAAGKDRFLAAYGAAMAAMPKAPERTLDVRTSYGIVRLYRFAGAHDDRPPLVLLPGRASSSPMWADNLPSLLRLRSVYTVDLLGEPGMSVQDRPITSDRDHAAWLHETLVRLPEPRVHLVGVSVGGWTAMNLAVHDPGKVATLTLVDPVCVFAGLSLAVVVRSLPAAVPWLPKWVREDFTSWVANDAPVRDEPIGAMIEAGMQTYRITLSAPSRLDGHRIAAVDVPTLVIMAGDSRMHDAAAAADTARRTLRAGTVITYPDASHAINGEYPDRLARDIGAHLDRHG